MYNPRWWQLLRHSRGFGIHSPFAFRFITEVLNERLPYYAYDNINATVDGHSAHEWRTLFRVLVYFRPKTVAIISDKPEFHREARRVLHLALPQATTAESTATSDFIISDCYVAEPYLNAFFFSATPANYPRPSHGMTFTNNRTLTVRAALSHLPSQHILVRF